MKAARTKRTKPAADANLRQALWPATQSVERWIVTSAKKALLIEDPEKRIQKLSFAVERLVDRGMLKSARPLFAKLVREDERHEAEWLSSSLMRLYVTMGRRDHAAAAYRKACEAVERDKKARRPAERLRTLAILRDDAVRAGLPEFADEMDARGRIKALADTTMIEADRAARTGDKAAARALLRKATKLAAEQPFAKDHGWPWWQIRVHALVGDRGGVRRWVDELPLEHRNVRILGESLLSVGLDKVVAELARTNIAHELEDARTMTLPNYHFPAMAIASTLRFLLAHDHEALARTLLADVFREIGSWDTKRSGIIEAAVFSSLADVVARLDGLAAAEALLDRAAAGAESERSKWRSGAWAAVMQVYMTAGAWDQAILIAGRQSPPDYRRRHSAIVFAHAKQWKNMRAVLSHVASPIEASEIAWWIAASFDPALAA